MTRPAPAADTAIPPAPGAANTHNTATLWAGFRCEQQRCHTRLVLSGLAQGGGEASWRDKALVTRDITVVNADFGAFK